MTLALGLMSGTSGDGVSIALADFKNRGFKTLGYKTFPYSPLLSKKISRVLDLKTPELSKLNVELGIYFADCTVKFLKKFRGRKIAVIGSHGHTVYHAGHDAPAHTLQLGEPSYLAERTGITVVSDFRPRDIAAGGQGAPLIPFFDEFFYGGKFRALQNIGGIGNVTLAGTEKSVAFDTGPGNCLIDWAVQKHFGEPYDDGGKIAARGRIIMKAVAGMGRHPFFYKKPPKSTGRELFNERWIPAALKASAPEDMVATLTYFTAWSIYEGYRKFLPRVDEILVSGGGALNNTLMLHLRKFFGKVPVRSIESTGLSAQAKEPVAFAFFALRALEGKTNHCPAGTGAKHPAILGKITPGRSWK